MCTEVQTLHHECQHRQYQNTYHCHIARRCDEKDEMILIQPTLLPTPPSKIPPGLLSCKRRVATRPTQGLCLECKRKRLAGIPVSIASSSSASGNAEDKSSHKSAGSLSSMPSIPEEERAGIQLDQLNEVLILGIKGRQVPVAIADARDCSPSPDREAVKQVRNSLLRMSQLYETSPQGMEKIKKLKKESEEDEKGGGYIGQRDDQIE
ncbi:uncharacterized protein BCR38DRAFT_409631 [Pseudomassariella vexata]|uniref:Uncharacterized protein n=1 Tax=Pseudomassariella vexata TaxID=1141098 RepID=A0A1Y2DY69_9PEZI|nr:uncharacterized protein BCR38DRAFT_409631 [Pseudomassariella vexata]ORY64248.1 hypothetical protein BCR38DRAFT_409631 [Pseudomassariella vexata]